MKVSDQATREERVAGLEKAMERANDRITAHDTRNREEHQRTTDALSAERADREGVDGVLTRRLEGYTIGSIDWELAGVWWVIVGQAFGSFRAEIGGVLSGTVVPALSSWLPGIAKVLAPQGP